MNTAAGSPIELEDNIYSFQTCQFFQYFRVKRTYDDARLRSVARRYAFSTESPPYLRSEARAILTIYGTSTDLEALLSGYPEARNELEIAEIVCSLAKLETSRRNAFYASLSGSSWLVDRTIEAVRAGRILVDPVQPR